VFGCGGDRDQAKRELMGAVASQVADHVVITNDNPRSENPNDIAQAISNGVNGDARVVLDRAEAINTSIAQATENEDNANDFRSSITIL